VESLFSTNNNGAQMLKALLFCSMILLCGCHAGVHFFKSDNGMMIQELEAAKMTDAEFSNE
jgi:hypothetical protein